LSATSIERSSAHRTPSRLEVWVRGVPTRLASARWPVAVTGLVVVGAATWWVTNSSIFDLRELRVEGNVHLTKAQVARVGHLTHKTNVLWTLPGTIERTLETHPWIKEAHVSRTLPSALTVTITERRAVATLPGSGSVLAPDGQVLGKKGAHKRLPVIEPESSGHSTATGTQSGEALAVARAMPTQLRQLVDQITVGRGGLIALHLRDGTRVNYGDGSRAREKAAVLKAVLSWAERNGTAPSIIDVSVPGAPTLIPAHP
jgi:cell division protein FtsQ